MNQRPDFNLSVHQLNKIAGDAALYIKKNYTQRAEALDFIEFELIAAIEYLLLGSNEKSGLVLLKQEAEKVKLDLDAIDDKLFRWLRAKIQTGLYTGQAFINLVKQYVNFDLNNRQHQQAAGYDGLDFFINNLVHFGDIPEQTLALGPEMVYYQKTPARIIFELVDMIDFTDKDVFFDLGSGLGQVAILVNLLTRVKTIGIEFEPAFCSYATSCANALNLNQVKFVNTDARYADYTDGSVFFMFTPFNGEIMQTVLARLQLESLKRIITVITYGPCTAEVAIQTWLYATNFDITKEYNLTVFKSL